MENVVKKLDENIKILDSHCHLDDEKIEDVDYLVKGLYKKNIGFIGIGYNVESSKAEIEIAKKYNTFAAIGISPNDIEDSKKEIDEQIDKIEELYNQNQDKIVAIGEIGLDYYWNTQNKDLQKYAFEKQIALANKYDLPITIHSRDAYIDTIEVLKNNNVKNKGIFHCCQQNMELIKNALELDFYISLARPITYKSAKNADEIIKMIPDNRLLIETDSPYLAPVPYRGRVNTPINIIHIAKKIALVKQLKHEKVEQMTLENAKAIYKLG